MHFWDFRRSVASIAVLVKFAQLKGLEADKMLAGSGVSSSQLELMHLEVSAGQELRVVQNLIRALGHNGLGFEVGGCYHLSSFGLWGYGLISSATLKDAVKLALRFIQLTFAFSLIGFSENANGGTLTFGEPELDPVLTQFLIERDMAAALNLLHELTAKADGIERIEFRTRKLAFDDYPQKHQPEWPEYPLTFGCARNQILMSSTLLDYPLPQANPMTVAMCEQLCTELIQRRLQTATTSERVRQYLRVPGVGCPDLPTMARMLHLSERTFRRRLSEEGTSYRDICAATRREMALEMLQNKSITMAEIGETLGFSDLSSFSQAFKRWTGLTATQCRKNL